MKKTNTLTLATGVAFAATVAMAPAQAADNPFGMDKLDGGYQLAQADKAADDKKKDGKCGEGKCGADKKAADDKKMDDKKKDGSCGGDKKKDGACGGKR